MAHAVALIREEQNSSFGVSFPDFPGCSSAATNLNDAIARAAVALAAHVKSMGEHNQALPALRTIDDIRRTLEIHEAIIAAVPVDLPGKSIAVQISINEHLLAALDQAARASGVTRSEKIAEAIRASLRV
ncbi:type II toxin-antitoxin system HicB family antitoxin [Pleomorphomonas sp. PLEO]|uniref:type II toxin-antitoxin system HicB family antitoxin n=1 Tax=Pleomorphomonas sp. PLEO TaxID=3239306 RepID=UPI00351EC564